MWARGKTSWLPPQGIEQQPQLIRVEPVRNPQRLACGPRDDKTVECSIGQLRIHAHGDKSGLENGLIGKRAARTCLSALTGIARAPSHQSCVAELVVSREGRHRESTQLLITKYCPDLAHRPVPLRPVRPHQVVVHAPILHRSDQSRST